MTNFVELSRLEILEALSIYLAKDVKNIVVKVDETNKISCFRVELK